MSAPDRPRMPLAVHVMALSMAALAMAAAWSRVERGARERSSIAWRDARTPAERDDGWVGSDACRACHPAQHASWHASFHRTMTQRVAPETVIGAFDGRTLDDGSFAHRVERRGDEFWVYAIEPAWLMKRALEGPDAVVSPPPARWQRVVMSTGAHNMQMYWVPAGDGNRLVAFPFAWSVEGEMWVPNESTLLRPREPYVVYGWNDVCVKCHAVGGEPGFELGEGPAVQTRVAELGIACEACHGPGAEHVEGQGNPLRRYMAHLREAGEAELGVVNPASLDGHAASEVCGQCHSASLSTDDEAWLRRGSGYLAGGALEKALRIVRHPARADQPWIEDTLDGDPDYLAGRFWGDGMIRISGREFNGTRESPCWQDPDFGCMSCHELHGEEVVDQLSEVGRGDQACLQCHGSIGESLATHTRHDLAGEGSRCVNCHMPPTTYGLLKGIRSHEISVPSVEESVDYGRPNACNICHLDRDLAWTADALREGWGLVAEAPPKDETPIGLRWLVAGDAGQRALAAWYFGWGPARATVGEDWMAPWLAAALEDEYAAVRWIALRSLRSIQPDAPPAWTLAVPAGDAAAARPGARALIEDYMSAMDGGETPSPLRFEESRLARLRAERDERIVDLRE